MTLLGRRGVLLLLLLAIAIVLPPYFGTYYIALCHADRDLRHGGAERRPSARLYRADHVRTGGAVRRGRLRRGHADGLWRYQCVRGVAARHPDLDAVRAGDRKSLAAHPRLPIHHGDARLRADGLLLRPEPAQLGRRRRLHRAPAQSPGLRFARRSRDILLRRARAAGARGLCRQPDRRDRSSEW